MPGAARHPKGEVEEALADVEAKGVVINVLHHGHVWARLYCACGSSEHQGSVGSTPKNPGSEAQRVRSLATRWERAHERKKEEDQK